MDVNLRPIGIIHTPFTSTENMPIQPAGAVGVRGTVEVFAEFVEGLRDLAGFSHIVLLYHFHRAGPAMLTVTPFLDDQERGVFATRAPRRPNPIGLSVVRLLDVEDNRLQIEAVDMLDGTPLLDIKPYVVIFDAAQEIRQGWLEGRSPEDIQKRRSDERFS